MWTLKLSNVDLVLRAWEERFVEKKVLDSKYGGIFLGAKGILDQIFFFGGTWKKFGLLMVRKTSLR